MIIQTDKDTASVAFGTDTDCEPLACCRAVFALEWGHLVLFSFTGLMRSRIGKGKVLSTDVPSYYCCTETAAVVAESEFVSLNFP